MAAEGGVQCRLSWALWDQSRLWVLRWHIGRKLSGPSCAQGDIGRGPCQCVCPLAALSRLLRHRGWSTQLLRW